MIVWLASYPRSGNTFARIVLETCLSVPTLTSNDYYFDDQPRPTPPPWDQSSVSKLGLEPPPVASVAEAAQMPRLFGLKTHSQHRPTSDPAIYFVRDGRDAIVSYAYYVHERLEQRSRESITPEQIATTIEHLLVDPDPDYGSWSANVDAWTSRPNVAVIPFTTLIADPVESLAAALDQLGLSYSRTGAQPPTFNEMQSKVPSFFRSGSNRRLEEHLPARPAAALLGAAWPHDGAARVDCRRGGVSVSRETRFLRETGFLEVTVARATTLWIESGNTSAR